MTAACKPCPAWISMVLVYVSTQLRKLNCVKPQISVLKVKLQNIAIWRIVDGNSCQDSLKKQRRKICLLSSQKCTFFATTATISTVDSHLPPPQHLWSEHSPLVVLSSPPYLFLHHLEYNCLLHFPYLKIQHVTHSHDPTAMRNRSSPDY